MNHINYSPPTLTSFLEHPFLLASLIDHTFLNPTATTIEIDKICQEAIHFGFASVCVHSGWIPYVTQKLMNSKILPISVVGFPHGAMHSLAKAYEAEIAIRHGAREIDMVIQIGALKEKNYSSVLNDIKGVVNASEGMAVKVILETGFLSEAEKVQACQISLEAGAHFVKTSTGFGPGSATPEDVTLMRQTVGSQMGVKASGGIRTFEKAIQMIQAGANRIGASAGAALLKKINVDLQESSESY